LSLAPKCLADTPRTHDASAAPSSQRSAGTRDAAPDDGRTFLDTLLDYPGASPIRDAFALTMPPPGSGLGDPSGALDESDERTPPARPPGGSTVQACVASLTSSHAGDDAAARTWTRPFESGQAVIDSKRAGRVSLTMTYDGTAFSVAARAGSSRLRATLDRERARLEAALSEAAGLPVSLQIDTEAHCDDEAVDRAPVRVLRG
jgi:hypothetical protein